MKITYKNKRIDKDGRHNDRNFDLSHAGHIDPQRVSENLYYTYEGKTYRHGEMPQTFEELEKEYYEKNFKDCLEERNQRNIRTKHKNRVITMKQYRESLRTRPEDQILQIGNIDDHVSGEVLWECALEYARKFDMLYGEHCKILDMALHMDEATPHVHIRRVWTAVDDNGNKCVNETRALEELGFSEPNKSLSESKSNNSKIAFTNTGREMFFQICREHGIQVERASGKKQKELSILEYKIQKVTEKLKETEEKLKELSPSIKAFEELDKQVNELFSQFIQNQFLYEKWEHELEIARKKSILDKLNILTEIYRQEAKNLKDSKTIDESLMKTSSMSEYRAMDRFIRNNDLYGQYLESKRKTQEKNGR